MQLDFLIIFFGRIKQTHQELQLYFHHQNQICREDLKEITRPLLQNQHRATVDRFWAAGEPFSVKNTEILLG